MRAHEPWIELSRPQVMLLQRERRQCASNALVGLQMACAGACACSDGWSQRQVRWQERGRRFCRLERDLPTPSSHPVCLCVAQQQAVDCASLCKPQWRLQRAAATWALALGRGLVVGPARAHVELCGGHGYAVHARPVCAVVGRVDGVQRPLCWRVCRQPLGRPLGLRCAVCSRSMLHAPTLAVAGHGKVLGSVRVPG
jgi:hypothetical protein